MTRLTASKLRADVYRILDEVLETGVPVEIERNGKLLRIAPVAQLDVVAISKLHGFPDAVLGEPEDWDLDVMQYWDPDKNS